MVSRAGSGCDAAVLQREVLAAFVAPDCSWLAHEAETLLGRIDDVDALRGALADAVGRKRALVDRVVREKTGEGMLTLTLREAGDGIEAVLTKCGGEVVATRTLTRAMMPDELRFVGEAIADPARTVIDIASELDETMSYQAMLRLGDVVACELRMGSTRRTMRGGVTREDPHRRLQARDVVLVSLNPGRGRRVHLQAGAWSSAARAEPAECLSGAASPPRARERSGSTATPRPVMAEPTRAPDPRGSPSRRARPRDPIPPEIRQTFGTEGCPRFLDTSTSARSLWAMTDLNCQPTD